MRTMDYYSFKRNKDNKEAVDKRWILDHERKWEKNYVAIK